MYTEIGRCKFPSSLCISPLGKSPQACQSHPFQNDALFEVIFKIFFMMEFSCLLLEAQKSFLCS